MEVCSICEHLTILALFEIEKKFSTLVKIYQTCLQNINNLQICTFRISGCIKK